MSKIRWLLAAVAAALLGLVLVLGVTAPAGADPGTIVKFDTMTPVTGPYVGSANPIIPRSKTPSSEPSTMSAMPRYPSSAQAGQIPASMHVDKWQVFVRTWTGRRPTGCGR